VHKETCSPEKKMEERTEFNTSNMKTKVKDKEHGDSL